MIAIARAEEPTKLKRSRAKDAWKSVADVRTTLHDMQAGKCCYCERRIPSCGPGQEIEHYWPKAHYDDKRNLWKNLLLACDRCNHKKLDSFPLDDCGQPLVIDPTSANVNPESEITFTTQYRDAGEYRLMGQAVPTNGSSRGDTTIEVVGLTMKHHRQRRRRHYERVLLPWLQRHTDAHDDGDEAAIKSLRDEMERHMDGTAEYASFVRAFARQYELEVAVPGGVTT